MMTQAKDAEKQSRVAVASGKDPGACASDCFLFGSQDGRAGMSGRFVAFLPCLVCAFFLVSTVHDDSTCMLFFGRP
jgi:hypothetical protein